MHECPANVRSFGAAAFVALAVAGALGAGEPTQEAELVLPRFGDFPYYGTAVALDGDTAVVLARQREIGATPAYVFTRTGTTWTQEAELAPSDAAHGEAFGSAVAIDGETVVLGGHVAGADQGAVYVFRRTGTTWRQEARLTAADAVIGDRFAVSVAVAGDTAVVGASEGNASRGAAYVFRRTGTTWTQEARLAPAGLPDYTYFGTSVAFAGDTAVVGTFRSHPGQDAAFVFTRAGTKWRQEAGLSVADLPGDWYHEYAVAIAGGTVVLGASGRNQRQGVAYVFTRTGMSWTQEAKLTAADAADGDVFGSSVAFADETAVVGAPGENGAHGAAYVFTRTGAIWTQSAKLAGSDVVAGDRFGNSVSVAGRTAAVVAPRQDYVAGAAYLFALPAVPPPAPGYCLPKRATVAENVVRPALSRLTASGTLDTGGAAPDFSGAATFDVGGFHLDVPAFVAKGRSLTYRAGGIALTITPSRNGSSCATFNVKAVGDLAGKVGPGAPLALRFRNAVHDLNGSATLAKGTLRPRGVTAPALAVLGAAATLRGPGADSLELTLRFATDGRVPAAAKDMTVGFGDAYTSPLLPGTSFVRRGTTHVFSAKAPGIVKVTVKYAGGTIKVAGTGLDLGTFDAGGNSVVVTLTRGGDSRSIAIRMSLAGAKLAY